MASDVDVVAELPKESASVNTRRVLTFVFGFLAFVAVLYGLLRVDYGFLTSGTTLNTPLKHFPAPQLQPNPSQDYRNFHAAQVKQLEGYGWVDRTKEMIHVPIDRAMAVVTARGSAAFDPVQGTTAPSDLAATGAPLDGEPRAKPSQGVAPYGDVR